MNRNQLLKWWIIQIIAQWALSCMITSIVVAGSFLAKPRGILDRIGMVIFFGSLMLGVIWTLLGTKNHVASMYERFTGEEITEVAYNMLWEPWRRFQSGDSSSLSALCSRSLEDPNRNIGLVRASVLSNFLEGFQAAFHPSGYTLVTEP